MPPRCPTSSCRSWPRLWTRAPAGDRWLHEIKFDGYRTGARIEAGKVQMLTRKGLDWTAKFAPIAKALAKLPARTAYLDGEIVALGLLPGERIAVSNTFVLKAELGKAEAAHDD